MRKYILTFILCVACCFSFAQIVKVTGGTSFTRGDIDAETLTAVIQQKQEEIFTRVFQNIVVRYLRNTEITEGVNNFPTYYSLYNLMTDLTVNKSKTPISKAVINSSAELAYIYTFFKFYRMQEAAAPIAALTNATLVSQPTGYQKDNDQTLRANVIATRQNEIERLNLYMEAAFHVLANNNDIQSRFQFSRPITSSEVRRWYEEDGLINTAPYNTRTFTTYTGVNTTLPQLIAAMQTQINNFINYATSLNPNRDISIVSSFRKTGIGYEAIDTSNVNAIKRMLFDYGNLSDYLFSQNLVKRFLHLIVENTNFATHETTNVFKEVFIDVESLILSLHSEFAESNKRSSTASALFFVNPRLFFTIGTSNAVFLNKNNQLINTGTGTTSIRNVALASEKIGFRVQLVDFGYTRSFDPGQVFRYKGTNRIWLRPQKKPLVSSVYYNIYASGLLYNVLDLKTNENFDFGFVSSNVGLTFFNGLEFSTGIGVVYNDNLRARNAFFKADFDIPIIDYISALRRRRANQ